MKINKPYNYIGDPNLRGKAEELAKQAYKEGIINTDFGTLFDQVESEDINLAKLQDLDDITVEDKEGFVVDNDVDSQEISIEFSDGEIETYSYTELNKLINKGSRPSAQLGSYTPMGSSSSKGEYLMVTKKGDENEGKIGRNISVASFNSTYPHVILDFSQYGVPNKKYDKTEVTDEGFDAYGLPNPPDDAIVSDVYDDEFFKWGNAKITEDWERSPLEFDDKGEIIFKPNTSEAEKKRIKAEFEKDLKDMGKMRYNNGGALDKEFKFDKNFVIYVPSTTNVGSKINPTEMDVRVDSVGKFVADKFGGFTKTETDGGYKATDGDIIEEDIVKVSVFAKDFDWDKHEDEVVTKVKEWAKKWGQEAIGFEYEGKLYYIDEEGKFMDGGEIEESLPYTATFKEGGEVKESDLSKWDKKLDEGEDVVVYDKNGVKYIYQGSAYEKSDTIPDAVAVMKGFDESTYKIMPLGEIKSIEIGNIYAEGGGISKFSNLPTLTRIEYKSDWSDKTYKGFILKKESRKDVFGNELYKVLQGAKLSTSYGKNPKVVAVNKIVRVIEEATPNTPLYDLAQQYKKLNPSIFRNSYAEGGKVSDSDIGETVMVIGEDNVVGDLIGIDGNTAFVDFSDYDKRPESGEKRDYFDITDLKVVEYDWDKNEYYAEGGKVGAYKIDEVLRHFVNAALWSSTNDEDEPLEDEYDFDNIPKEELDKLRGGITKFIEDNEELLQKYNITDQAVGHDLFLDSQGHGVGFWDRGYDKADGDELSESASKIFASDPPYAQDGKVYFSNVKYEEGGEITVSSEGGQKDVKIPTGSKIRIEKYDADSDVYFGRTEMGMGVYIDGKDRDKITTYAEGGKVEMIEIDEDGSNVPPQLMDIFSEFNEDEDPYKEMENLRAKANEIGYDFSYGLDGTPTEFCEIPKKSWGGGIAIGTAVGGYVGYKIGRARPQKKGFKTEKKIGKKISKALSKGKEKSGEATENTKQWLQS